MTDSPKGVLAIILVDGRVGATAVDFDNFSAFGRGEEAVIQAQKSRAMAKVGRELIKQYGGPVIARLIDEDEAKQMAYDIFCGRKQGFEYKEELIGYDTQE